MFIFLSLINISSAYILLLPQYEEAPYAHRIAANIANEYYLSNPPTYIWTNNDYPHENLDTFLQNYVGTILLEYHGKSATLIRQNEQPQYRVEQYLIEIKHYKDLDHFFNLVINERSFQNSGKFIIVCIADSDAPESCDGRKIFDVCWKYYVANVLLLDQNERGKVTLSTYFPMSGGQCGNTEQKTLQIMDNWAEFRVERHLFPAKFNNFGGCPIRLSVINFPPLFVVQEDDSRILEVSGTEGAIYPIVAEHLRATLQPILPFEGQLFGKFNGSYWTGMKGDVFNRKTNLSVCIIARNDLNLSFRTSYPYRTVYTGWATPPPPMKPAWMKLMSPFDCQVRLYLLIVIMLVTSSLFLLKTTYLRRFWDSYFIMNPMKGSIGMDTCAIFLGQLALKPPHKAVLSFVFALWLWFSFFIRNGYQGSLVGSLKQDQYYSYLDTVQGAIDAGYAAGGMPLGKELLAEKPELYKKFIEVEPAFHDTYFDAMANGSLRFIYYTPLDDISFHNSLANYSKYVYIMKGSRNNYPVTNIFPLDSPLVDTVGTLFGRIASNGIANKLSSEFDDYILKTQQKRERNTGKDMPLKMHHMSPCFFLLIVGWLLALTLFCTELLFHRYKITTRIRIPWFSHTS